MAKKTNEKKRRRRFGDRPDGRKIRSLAPMNYLSPYLMPVRTGASNMFSDSLDMENVEKYIKEKQAAGLKGFGMLHIFVAAYVRTVSQRPGINRFISRQKIFARNNIEIIMTIKKELSLNAEETVIKVYPKADATAEEVFKLLNDTIAENKGTDGDESDFDGVARIVNYIPGLLLKFFVWCLKTLDYFGLMPKALLKVSPFHGSLVITSLGSLGIPPVYHHLYDFGNAPLFIAFGAKRRENVIEDDGSVKKKAFVDYRIVTDERICDGHYYASALKYMRKLLKNPYLLDTPPEAVIEDID